jgi:transcriptional regulator with XRE-family HTH domain
MVCQDLHVRLRQARERKGLTLSAVARAKGVREHNLQLIERDAFEDLPTGLYGRAAVRAYASAVGFDADAALAEVADRVRRPEDPIDGLARVRGIERPRPRPPSPRLWRGFAGALRAKAERTVEVAPAVRHPVRLPISWRGPLAAVVDSALLIAIDAALLALTAAVARVRPIELLQSALPALLVVFLIIAAMYFVLLGGVRRATIGAQLVQAEHAAVFDSATVHAVVQRGWRYAVDEARLFGGSVARLLGSSVAR